MVEAVSAGPFRIRVEKDRYLMGMAEYGENARALRSVRLLDRLLFSVYVFSYLMFFQTDLMWYVHNKITDGAISFYPFWLSLLFSSLIILSGIAFTAILRFKGAWEACNYLPSMLLLAAATSYTEQVFVGHSIGTWMVIVILAAVTLLLCRFLSELVLTAKNDYYKFPAVNLLLVCMVMLIPPSIGNSDELMHRELRAQRLYEQGKYEQLLKVGKKTDETSPRLEALRAEALSLLTADKSVAGSELGRRLFEYPQHFAVSTASVLEMDTLSSGAQKENRRLSAMLLRKNLRVFSSRLYHSNGLDVLSIASWHGDMPVYYLQALLLNDYLNADSTALLYDRFGDKAKTQKKLLDDYLEQKSSLSEESLQYQSNTLYKRFADTYYWYFDFSD